MLAFPDGFRALICVEEEEEASVFSSEVAIGV